MIEKQGIINLSSYNSESYAIKVLWNSVVDFLQEGEDAAFHSFLICILVMT